METKYKKDIYLKSAELIRKGTYKFGCLALEKAFGKPLCYFEKQELFPEFFLFKPDRNESIGWWYMSDKESRINALLLCSEMCN